jgi:hypothetical protein
VGPKFGRLARALSRGVQPLTLREDPTALAPETLLVFELSGSLITFARAVEKIGLRLVGEEPGRFEERDAEEPEIGQYYLTIPDIAALQQLQSLWTRYQQGHSLGEHHLWAGVFNHLHDLRRWSPKDRVSDQDQAILLEDLRDAATARFEIELAPARSEATRQSMWSEVGARVQSVGGRVLSQAQVPEIEYLALLVETPAAVARSAALREPGSLAEVADIFAIRPQAVFSPLPVETDMQIDRAAAPPSGTPIVAVLDAVPVANHPLLADRLIVDDPDDLGGQAVGARIHGTAMASLVVWGDLNLEEAPLSRPVILRPLLFAPPVGEESFPDGALIVDNVVRAVESLLESDIGNSIIAINFSVADRNRPFGHRVSAWARALDYLAYKYGVLFIVSAGNVTELIVPAAPNGDAFAALVGEQRARASLAAYAIPSHRGLCWRPPRLQTR